MELCPAAVPFQEDMEQQVQQSILPTITVIIPTHNRAHTLARALESVLTQTAAPLQVLVVDDGSTDDTALMLSRDFPQVEYLFQENAGVSAARNLGLEQARGQWIAFLDSDDSWLPQKLQMQIAAIQRAPDYQICHTDEIWIRRGRRVNAMNKHAKSGGWIFQRCLEMCRISPSSVLIERSVFDAIGGFDESLPACEDYDLWLRITARYPVLYIDEKLIYKYGGHDDQLSHRYWGMDRFRIVSLEKLIAAGDLNQQQREAALNILIDKLVIFVGGARKRDKEAEVTLYEDKLRIALEQRGVDAAIELGAHGENEVADVAR